MKKGRDRPDPSLRCLPLLPEATGQCLLAAGRPPDRQLPFRWQLWPVGCVRRHPAAGACAQLCALRSVFRTPGEGLVLLCHLGLLVTVRNILLFPSRSLLHPGVGAHLTEVKPGPREVTALSKATRWVL